MHCPIKLTNAILSPKPFPHFHVPGAIDFPFSVQLLDWLETGAPWRLKVESFYEQYEFSLLDLEMPPEFLALCDAETLSYLRKEISGLFQSQLSNNVDVTAHQLVPGQRIRIHNDFIPGRETHRLLLQLNRDYSDECGGLLLLFEKPEPESACRMIRPISCSAVGFEISPNSHHAVSTVHKGKRFTLVYSFYEQPASNT